MALPVYEDTLVNDPAFFHLTRTNEAPLPAEETVFLDMIADLEAKSVATERSLSAETDADTICSLQADKKEIQEAIQRRKAVLSAVRRLPFEILGHIFMHTQSVEEEETKWTIARVCKTWRASALSFPRLWSFITIRYYGFHDHSNLSRLPTQLRLARQTSLFVAFCIYSAGSDLFGAAVKLLLECADRIRWLRLDVPNHFLPALLPLKGHLPSLISLAIVNQGIFPSASIDLFAQCSQLRDVETYAIPSLDSAFTIPWANVTSYTGFFGNYTFRAKDIHQTISILQNAPKLVNAVFRLNAGAGAPGKRLRIPVVECANLRFLHVADADIRTSPPFRRLFGALTLPALFNFDVSVHPKVDKGRMLDSDVFTSMVDLVERSRSALYKISYEQGSFLPADVARLLRVAPTLRTFSALRTRIIDETVRELFNVSCSLEHITLSGCLQFDPQLFLAMLRARSEVRQLVKLELGWITSAELTRETADEALRVISEGVEAMGDSKLKFSGKVTVVYTCEYTSLRRCS